MDNALFTTVRHMPNFYRFLPSNQHFRPLTGNDLKILEHFMMYGEIAGKSKVYFDENNRIVVTEGPLKGLEGNIIKVDRRKKRAKIELEFETNTLLCDLSFDIIAKGEEKCKKKTIQDCT